jgi:hypothetical protein
MEKVIAHPDGEDEISPQRLPHQQQLSYLKHCIAFLSSEGKGSRK